MHRLGTTLPELVGGSLCMSLCRILLEDRMTGCILPSHLSILGQAQILPKSSPYWTEVAIMPGHFIYRSSARNRKVLKIIAHMRTRSQLADSLTNMLNWYQLATGGEEHCLETCQPSPHVFAPWVTSLIKFLHKSGLHLRIPHLWKPTKP